jgi:hypothetical protein
LAFATETAAQGAVMFETLREPKNRWRFYWPRIDDQSDAEEVILLCCLVFFVIAALWTLLGVLFVTTDPREGAVALVRAALLAVVAFGVWRKWRAAAVMALVLGVLNLIGSPLEWMRILEVVAAANGVRGTFAFARFSKSDAAPASLPIDSDERASVG